MMNLIRRKRHLLALASLPIAVLGSTCFSGRAYSALITLRPVQEGSRFGFVWDAQPDLLYKVQSASNLVSNGGGTLTWTFTDIVSTNQVGPVKWMAPESMSRTMFYRLVLPQPDIFDIEPGIVTTGGGETVYIVGQDLGTNGQVRLGTSIVPTTVLTQGRLYSFTAPPLAEGVYDLDWLENGQLVVRKYKLYSVTGQPTPIGRATQPFEPP